MKSLLIFSQVYVPDPAAVGQYIAELAQEMAGRGHRVRVLTSSRGYEDPSVRYPPFEILGGVEVRRLPLSSFGKKTILTRVLGTVSFMVQCLFRGLFLPRVDGIFFSTSPPMIGGVAGVIRMLRRTPIAYWAMDLNPDQLIALGKVERTSFTARVLETINRFILRQSSLVVALDRFMAERLAPRAANLSERMLIMPPWPHESHIDAEEAEVNPFRQEHGLEGKFVVMYSGNHSTSNPLTTLLRAAVELKGDPDLRFVFVGGGIAKKEVEQVARDQGVPGILSLPYQPLRGLRHSLAAADVHVVSLGQDMVGIIHPCKIYSAMAASRPVLYFGPRTSHVTDLLDLHHIGLQVSHGDVAGAVQALQTLRNTPPQGLRQMGRQARAVLRESLSQEVLCGRLCDRLEEMMGQGQPSLIRS